MQRFTIILAALFLALPSPAQTIKATSDEVVLDLIARDKKGKPITDLKKDDITVSDNGAKQSILGFRLIRGSEALTDSGASAKLDPLHQLRLVTLAFESLGDASQRKLARTAALDLIKGEQGTNVFYSVVMANTRLLILQQFTRDKALLQTAIEKATAGTQNSKLISESDSLVQEMSRHFGVNGGGSNQDTNAMVAAFDAAGQAGGQGAPNTDILLAKVLLDMMRLDAGAQAVGTRLSLNVLKSLVLGLQPIAGRKSILYFTAGMVVPSELDQILRNLIGTANRSNMTFYAIDTRGVSGGSGNGGATSALRSAAAATAADTQRVSGGSTKEDILAGDTAENSGRMNDRMKLAELADSTGGFLVSDSNDLRGPIRKINEDIASYYELTFNPGIQTYDGSFRKLSVATSRKDLVIQARNGYFALPPEARAAGLETFELPLLREISDGKLITDVNFHAGAVLLQPKAETTRVSLMLELPLHELKSKAEAGKPNVGIHFSLGALVKNDKGEVVQKMTRDRALQVTPEQLKAANFVDKAQFELSPGKYTLESVVKDVEGARLGVQRAEFTVPQHRGGVAISSLTSIRSYTPNVKGLDPEEPFQYQGGSITPTLNSSVSRAEGSALRLFFTVYQDPAIKTAPAVEIEFMLDGKSLTKVPLPLPAADAQGKIPYVMTIPASSIPPGLYEVVAHAKQGASAADSKTTVRIEAK